MPPRKPPAPKAIPATPASAGPFKVAGQTMYLDLPVRPSVRSSLAGGFTEVHRDNTTVRLVLAAALGVCWTAGHTKSGAPRYGHKILEYGADFFDWIVSEALAAGKDEDETIYEIVIAGNAALDLVLARGRSVTEEAVEDAKGFSSATEEAGSAKSSA